MDKKAEIVRLVCEQGVLPLYFHKDVTVCIDVMKALYNAGVKTIEFTNRGAAAFENFKEMKKVKDAELPDMQIGIGTIKNKSQAKAFIDAGADFLVSPGFVKEAADEAEAAGLLYAPGCMTPTEIIAAENYGLTFIKLFPGNVLGNGFVSAIKELFPAVAFMVTGGVEPVEENLSGWFKSGVAAVGMGSKLITKKVLEERNFEALSAQTKVLLELIKKVK